MVFLPQKADNLSESDFRPEDLYKEWRIILEKEFTDFIIANKDSLGEVNCPGCQNNKKEEAFKIFICQYFRCLDCGTLFVSPALKQDKIEEFYSKSGAVKFWKNKIFNLTLKNRKEYYFKPLSIWVLDVIKAYLPNAKIIIDYKPKFFTLFSLVPNNVFDSINLVKPLILDLDSSSVHFNTHESINNSPQADVITAFNVLEREFSPNNLIQAIASKLKEGGMLFLTTNTISGFEYQILGSNSINLVPPDRQNLLSVEAVEQILNNNGFDIIDLSTPGKFDVEIVEKEFQRNPNLPLPDFFKYIFKHRKKSELWSLQNFLQLNNLSSFLRVVAIKRR